MYRTLARHQKDTIFFIKLVVKRMKRLIEELFAIARKMNVIILNAMEKNVYGKKMQPIIINYNDVEDFFRLSLLTDNHKSLFGMASIEAKFNNKINVLHWLQIKHLFNKS